MPEVRTAELLSMGGRNGGPVASSIEDNQFSTLTNWLPLTSRRLAVREGTRCITDTAHSRALNSVFSFSLDASTRRIVVGDHSKIGYLDTSDNTIEEIPFIEPTSFAGSVLPWRFRQYKSILYTVKRNLGGLHRSDASGFIHLAGIAAPTTAPTLADAGAGSIEAGDYLGVYTYVNSQTGQESNYSPASASVTIGSDRDIDWSGIVASSNPQVDKVYLYRTLPDQTGQYFFAGEISNGTTTFADSTALLSLDDRASLNNGVPPTGAGAVGGIQHLEVFADRMFLSDGIDLYFSESGSMESFRSSSSISVFPDDGHHIKQILAHGDLLMLPKGNKVHYLTGSDRSTFSLRTLVDSEGQHGESMRSVEGLLFWFTGTRVLQSTGSGVVDISTPFVQDLIDQYLPEYEGRITAAVDPSRSLYLLSLPLVGNYPSHTLVYNYRTQQWSVIRWDMGAPTEGFKFAEWLSGTDGAPALYGGFTTSATEGQLYQVLDPDAEDDDGADIVTVARGKGFQFDTPGMQHGVRYVSLLLYPGKVNSTITVGLVRDLGGTVEESRSVFITSDGWKAVNLAGMHKLAAITQLNVAYTGKTGLEWGGLTIRLAAFKRPVQRL